MPDEGERQDGKWGTDRGCVVRKEERGHGEMWKREREREREREGVRGREIDSGVVV